MHTYLNAFQLSLTLSEKHDHLKSTSVTISRRNKTIAVDETYTPNDTLSVDRRNTNANRNVCQLFISNNCDSAFSKFSKKKLKSIDVDV